MAERCSSLEGTEPVNNFLLSNDTGGTSLAAGDTTTTKNEEDIAGPSSKHYAEDEAAIDYDIDVLLDNTINENQERILQDNRTPERLINHNVYDENNIYNPFTLNVTGKQCASDDDDDDDDEDVELDRGGGVYIKTNNLFSDTKRKDELIYDNVGDDEGADSDEINDSWDDDPAGAMEEDEVGDLFAMESLPQNEEDSETVGGIVHSSGYEERVWRKRKLETQNSFPSKKLFPENNKTAATSEKRPVETEKRKRFNVIPTKDNPPREMSGWLTQFEQWSNAERLLAIDQLIERCEPTQVRHMMQVIEPQFQRDFISLLPKELALNVLSFLEPKDLLRAAQTCRSWRFLADDNLLWREKCREAGINELPQLEIPASPIDATIRSSTPDFDGPPSPSINQQPTKSIPIIDKPESPWKAAYMRQHSIEMNWRTKPIRPPKVLKGHDDHVITCLQFYGNRIVSGSDDNTLKVWSAVTGKCLKTLVGHTGGVWSSQMSGRIIVSGSTDRTLKVWNADTGVCIHTLYGHTSTVRCMHLYENRVVSGSRDATLRMWDVVSGECLHVLVGHMAAVRCVQYDGRLVVSGAYDYMVKVWNPEREECLHTFQGHSNRVYSLQFDGVHVVSGSLDTTIRVWEVETGACRHTLMGHQSLTSGMELRNNILVSGNADSTVKVWDIVTGQCLQTLSGANKHQSAVTCLQFNNRFVITSSDDGTVKLWDVRTGAFIRNLVALDSGGSGGVVWRIRASDTKLVCAVGSRNGTEETKLLVLDFDIDYLPNSLLAPQSAPTFSCFSSSNPSPVTILTNNSSDSR